MIGCREADEERCCFGRWNPFDYRAMQSMTGYGRCVVQDETYSIVAEVAAVNRKNLEIALSGPKEWFNLDRIAVELAKKRFVITSYSIHYTKLYEA